MRDEVYLFVLSLGDLDKKKYLCEKINGESFNISNAR